MVVDVGTRTLAMAQRVVHQVTRVLAPGCVPLFLTDGLKDSPRRYWLILASGFKPNGASTKGQDRSRVGCRYPSCSTPRWSSHTSAGASWGSSTAWYSARSWPSSRPWRRVADDQHGLHRAAQLDIRQRVAAVGRRVNTLCRGEEGLLNQMVLFQTYHNFVLLHASLRQPLPIAEATNGGSAKVWRRGRRRWRRG